jgi:SAM-dependent methyltransferase
MNDYKKVFEPLLSGNYSVFISALKQALTNSKSPQENEFWTRIEMLFNRGLNNLVDKAEEYFEEINPLVPRRAESFDDSKLKGFDYEKEYLKGAKFYLDYHIKHSGLTPQSQVLELGCGLGNFALALSNYLFGGSYYDLDISKHNINSCISRYEKYSNFKFALIDINQPNYNFLLERESKKGKPTAEEVRIPLRKNWYTLQMSHSVFTHMYTNQVRNYLKQVYEAMAPGGFVANTVFSVDDFAREQIRTGKATHLFLHEDKGFYWYYEPDPLMGNGFDKELLYSLHQEAGFKEITLIHGTWTTRPGDFYQDMLVARKE